MSVKVLINGDDIQLCVCVCVCGDFIFVFDCSVALYCSRGTNEES